MRVPLWSVFARETRFVIGRLPWRRQISSSGNNASCLVHLEHLWYIYTSDMYVIAGYISYPWPSPAEGIVYSIRGAWTCGILFREFHFRTPRKFCIFHLYRSTKTSRGESLILYRFISMKRTSRVDNMHRRNWLNGWSLASSDLHISVRGFCIDT